MGGLGSAFKVVAPHADASVWLVPLEAAFAKWGINTDFRVAASLGQFALESAQFTQLTENLNYTHAERIQMIWPSRFVSVTDAEPYCGLPEKLANRAYSWKLGNGSENSGDGWLFRGRGLIQLTGRDTYTQFAAAMGMSAEDAANWCDTPAGAAMSGAWFLSQNSCLQLADLWQLSKITRIVNGPALLNLSARIAASNEALTAMKSGDEG